jgi:hypothetical protein
MENVGVGDHFFQPIKTTERHTWNLPERIFIEKIECKSLGGEYYDNIL